MYTWRPLRRYSPAISPSLPNNFTRCHSVRSWVLPSRSLRTEVVASDRVQTAIPPCVYFTSGSLPRLPTRMTLLTPRARGCPSGVALHGQDASDYTGRPARGRRHGTHATVGMFRTPDGALPIIRGCPTTDAAWTTPLPRAPPRPARPPGPAMPWTCPPSRHW